MTSSFERLVLPSQQSRVGSVFLFFLLLIVAAGLSFPVVAPVWIRPDPRPLHWTDYVIGMFVVALVVAAFVQLRRAWTPRLVVTRDLIWVRRDLGSVRIPVTPEVRLGGWSGAVTINESSGVTGASGRRSHRAVDGYANSYYATSAQGGFVRLASQAVRTANSSSARDAGGMKQVVDFMNDVSTLLDRPIEQVGSRQSRWSKYPVSDAKSWADDPAIEP